MTKQEERARRQAMRRQMAEAAKVEAEIIAKRSAMAEELEVGLDAVDQQTNSAVRLMVVFDGRREGMPRDWPPTCAEVEIGRDDPDYLAIEEIYRAAAERKLAEMEGK